MGLTPAAFVGFLSTLPARGATIRYPQTGTARPYFYPRSPRGERPVETTLRARSVNFYPRSPRGERQKVLGLRKASADISIHAPREGSDLGDALSQRDNQHFYPRSPRGERPLTTRSICRLCRFLSTLPARGATGGCCFRVSGRPAISIHAPREGSDGSHRRGA